MDNKYFCGFGLLFALVIAPFLLIHYICFDRIKTGPSREKRVALIILCYFWVMALVIIIFGR